jgi:hypothetical protein
MFAELAILRLFQKNGWDGVWVDTFRKKYRTAWGEEGVVRLSGNRLQLLKTIHRKAGSASGCFDVYCWKDDHVVLAESKRSSKDEIRQSQLAWLEAAMHTGIDARAFLIVEWLSTGSLVGNRASRRANTLHRIKPVGVGAARLQMEHFLECVTTGIRPLCDGRAVRAALAVCLAAEVSLAGDGAEVSLSAIERTEYVEHSEGRQDL